MGTVLQDFLAALSPENRAWVQDQPSQRQLDLADAWSTQAGGVGEGFGVDTTAVDMLEAPKEPAEIADQIVAAARGAG
ncbi:hypothetical protein ACZ90_20315 [Streptomyces albus subsp. albus]|nr:hypothetical protein ACZ90_20315 [Streptomyces albus subsp. albus]